MVALIKMLAVVLVAVFPGGFVVLAAFILGRMLTQKLRTIEEGPARYRRVFASLSFRDVWDQTRRSLHH